MASTDARPVPRKNVAYRVTFPIRDASFGLVSGAAGLDSEISINAAAFVDCTNEATEIGSSGIYYIDLTSPEMNGDTVVHQTKTSTSGAKTAITILYPEEIGDYRIDPSSSGVDVPVSQRPVSREFIATIPKRSSGTIATAAPLRLSVGESVTLGVDFTALLAPGDLLSSITGVDVSDDILDCSPLGVDRELAKMLVSGGEPNTTYTLATTVVTRFGNTLEGQFSIIYA